MQRCLTYLGMVAFHELAVGGYIVHGIGHGKSFVRRKDPRVSNQRGDLIVKSHGDSEERKEGKNSKLHGRKWTFVNGR